MKIFFLILFVSHLSYGATLGQYISKPEGTSVQSFILTEKSVQYEKHSNFFDKEKSFTLGKFAPAKKLNVAQTHTRVQEMLKKIEEVDTFLKKKKSSFNELSTKKDHEAFFILNEYRITKGSDLYPEVKKIFEELASKEWKQISGIRISDSLEEVLIIENGKTKDKQKFNMSFHCEAPARPTVCGYKDLGILYIQ